MTTEIRVWEINKDEIAPVSETGLDLETRLENWIVKSPENIGRKSADN
jgi:hypothetical protein